MFYTWRHITAIVSIITIGYLPLHSKATADPNDWRQIESLAEQHPYVVALLNTNQEYVCTGTIINKRTVVTSGCCIAFDPAFVVVGAAIYAKNINNNTLVEIAYKRVHEDYTFELKATDPNVTRMHSNIGVVVVKRPILAVFITAANIGNYYASELQNKKIKAVGYGRLGNTDRVGLQYQMYRQTPCMNPKWYYCICGTELKSDQSTYVDEFGRGSPVVYESEVVGISAIPCGTLSLKTFKYNIFTVIGPYLQWIQKCQLNETSVAMRTKSSKGSTLRQHPLNKCIYILIVVSKVFG